MKFIDTLKTTMSDESLMVMSDLFYDKNKNLFSTKMSTKYILENYKGEDYTFTGSENVDSVLREFIKKHHGDVYCISIISYLHKIINANFYMYEKNSMNKNLEFAILTSKESSKYIEMLQNLYDVNKYIIL